MPAERSSGTRSGAGAGEVSPDRSSADRAETRPAPAPAPGQSTSPVASPRRSSKRLRSDGPSPSSADAAETEAAAGDGAQIEGRLDVDDSPNPPIRRVVNIPLSAQSLLQYTSDAGQMYQVDISDELEIRVVDDGADEGQDRTDDPGESPDPSGREIAKTNHSSPQTRKRMRDSEKASPSPQLSPKRERRRGKQPGPGESNESNPGPVRPTPETGLIEVPKAVFRPATSFRRKQSRRFPGLNETKRYNTYNPSRALLEGQTVEYDMDEEDQAWLELANDARQQGGTGALTEVVFERALDTLEKESFELAASMDDDPSQDLYDDDAVCAICLSGDCENANVILFCDACNLPVHQECYGVPFIPEGQWLCRSCMSAPSQKLLCALCPDQGGALKQSDDGKLWAHVTCTLWIPELFFGNHSLREPVSGMKDIPRDRFRLTCYICGEKNKGACIQCHKTKCFTAFHPICAQRVGLAMGSFRDENDSENWVQQAYCHFHTPPWSEAEPLLSGGTGGSELVQDTAEIEVRRAQQAGGAACNAAKKPTVVIPPVKAEVLMPMLQETGTDDADATALQLRQYWMLKRKSRHGVSLLRRLQLSSLTERAAEIHGERQKFQELRQILEKTRMMVGQTQRRERLKCLISSIRRDHFMAQVSPIRPLLFYALAMLKRKDPELIFAEPVSLVENPTYLDFVESVMDLSTMERKVEVGLYHNFKLFVTDFQLVCTNAMTFNQPESWYFNYAWDFLHAGNAVIEGVAEAAAVTGICFVDGTISDKNPDRVHPGAGIDVVFDLPLPELSTVNPRAAASGPAATAVAVESTASEAKQPLKQALSASTMTAVSGHLLTKGTNGTTETSPENTSATAGQLLTEAANDGEAVDTSTVDGPGNLPEAGVQTALSPNRANAGAEPATDNFEPLRRPDVGPVPHNTSERNVQRSGESESFAPSDVSESTTANVSIKSTVGCAGEASEAVGGVLADDIVNTSALEQNAALPGTNEFVEAVFTQEMIHARTYKHPSARTAAFIRLGADLTNYREGKQELMTESMRRKSGLEVGPRKKKKVHTPKPEVIKLVEVNPFPIGGLVWAKMPGFPWYPGKIVDPLVEDDGTGQNDFPGFDVLEVAPIIVKERMAKLAQRSSRANSTVQKESTDAMEYFLIRFFDRKRTWGWIDRAHIDRLLYDHAFDIKMLKSATKPSRRKEVKEAYALAKIYFENHRRPTTRSLAAD